MRWLPVPNYPNYKISSDGDLFSVCSQKYIKPRIQSSNIFVWLYKNGLRRQLYLARIVMETFNGKSDKMVRHKDGDCLNNKLSNLEYVTPIESQQMSNAGWKGTSKYRGVSYQITKRKWRAYITVNKVSKYLGTFEDEREAARSYNKAARKYFRRPNLNKIT